MLKRSIIAILAVAVLATVAQAGYIKTHSWPTRYVEQELMSIPVKIDVGYYVRVADQNKVIKMSQVTSAPWNFTGNCTINVKANFNLTLSAVCTSKGVATADSWGASVNPANVDSGIATDVVVTATATNLKVENIPAGTSNLEVATVKISVVPRT